MSLTDEKGNNVDYELLDIIDYNQKIYTVFYPTIEEDTEILILRVDPSDNPEQSIYAFEEDQKIVNEVFKKFKEKYEGEYIFK